MTKTIQKLPAPDGVSRVKTGVVQFGEDWPGVFFRGDNACAIGATLAGLVAGSIDRGRLESADFMLYGLLLAHARDLVACDQSGVMSGRVEQIHGHMMRVATLVDAPPVGGVQ